MDRVYERCCGIDVHKKIVVACFRCGRKQELREFGTTTKELLRLADWLIQNECQMIAIESTASYWKPLYNVFESCELKAMVVNARHMKAVPGKKPIPTMLNGLPICFSTDCFAAATFQTNLRESFVNWFLTAKAL